MDILRQSLAIALVFALLGLAAWLLRKKNGLRMGFSAARSGRGPLEPLGKLALGPQHALHAVRAGDRLFILAIHPRGMVVLGDVRDGATRPISVAE